MPLTGRVVASIYSFNGNSISRAGAAGLTNSFPSAQTMFFPAPANTVANGVTINSIIVLLGEGLKINDKQYGTDSTTTQLASNGS